MPFCSWLVSFLVRMATSTRGVEAGAHLAPSDKETMGYILKMRQREKRQDGGAQTGWTYVETSNGPRYSTQGLASLAMDRRPVCI